MICKHRADLFLKADREFHNNLLWIAATGSYRETKYFREAILYLIFNICELNPTNKVGNVVHEFLKTFFFKKAEYRTGACVQGNSLPDFTDPLEKLSRYRQKKSKKN